MLLDKKEEVKTYKGYSLFNDVEDFSLRSKNRGVVMVNMIEENYDKVKNKISTRGLALVVGYFTSILELERKAAYDYLLQELALRGIKYE
jgi:hypothetical protein